MPIFQWDDGNYPKNLVQRGLTQAVIESVFNDENPILIDRSKPEDSEFSWRITGKSNLGTIITVVFTIRKGHDYELIRPITAWPASRQERRIYAAKQTV